MTGGPDENGLAEFYRRRIERSQEAMSAWLGEVRPRKRHFRTDLVAGVPGAISSVPDGMAASVLAGVNPAHGLYASFAGPIAGGLTSSTRLMVITTTSAAALAAGSAISSVPADQRSDAMLWLTLLAGGLMILAAVVRLSRYIRFVSYSVMLGFLTGFAVNMVLGQLPDLLGVDASGLAVQKAWEVLTHPGDIDVASAVAGCSALAILALLGLTRVAVFSSLVALLGPTIAVVLLGADSVIRVKDSGAIPTGLPLPQLPAFSALEPAVIAGAAAVAALVLIQGAGVAEAVPNSDGSTSSTRRDFTAQGVGNLASGFFGGQPVGGSVGQTALNVTAGARTLQRLLPEVRAAGDGAGPVVVLRLRGRTTLGATFLKVVGGYAHALATVNGQLYLSGIDPELAAKWTREQVAARLAEVAIVPATPVLGESTERAIELAEAHVVRPVDPGDGETVSPGS